MTDAFSKRRVLAHPFGWFATFFGVGLIPFAPGTFGSLAALLPWWWLRELPLPVYLAATLLLFVLGVAASSWVINKTNIEDPGIVVLDEVVGQWLTLCLAPAGWGWMLLGFALFRLFDIWKPWPVRWVDRNVHGGFGAMADDALAGVMGFVVLQLIAKLSGVVSVF